MEKILQDLLSVLSWNKSSMGLFALIGFRVFFVSTLGYADYLVDDTCNPTFTTIVGVAGTVGLNQGDDDADNVNIPFSVPFYDNRYTVARVQSNGAVYFNPASGTIPYNNQSIPYSSVTAAAYPFWDDLNPASAGDVYWTVRGTAPNREFVVEWNNVPHYSNTGRVTFQMIIHESSGDIYFFYPDVDFGTTSYNNGASATIGLQSASNSAQQYSYNAATVSSGSAICYTFPKDFGDAPASYGDPSHGNQGVKSLFLGAGGDDPDIEVASQNSADGLGDNTSGSNDENGVTFRSPANSGKSIFADVVVNNAAGDSVTVCGWLDVPSGGGVDGNFDSSDGQCQTTSATNPTLTFQWSGLPVDQQYTTYARFRVSTEPLDTSTSDTFVIQGEVEDYRLIFDFQPTLAIIDNFRVELLSASEDFSDNPDTHAQFFQCTPETANVPAGNCRLAVVRWETVQEHGTVGFYIERQRDDGQWQRLNGKAMLPGLVNSPLGGEYMFLDSDVIPDKTFTYRLVEEDIWNVPHVYGPWTVTLKPETALPHAASMKRLAVQSKKPVASPTRFTAWRSLAGGFSGRARMVAPAPEKVAAASFVSPLPFKKVFGAPTHRVSRVRLKTRDTAMYQVTLDDLAAVTGINPSRISRKLEQNRWSFSTGDGGAAYYFDRENHNIVFAADSYRSIETLDNVYRLGKFRHRQGWKMSRVAGAGPSSGHPGQFRDTQYFAEENYLLTWIHSDENSDYGYWAMVYAAPAGEVDISVSLPDPATSSNRPGQLKIVLRGASDKVEGNDHQASVSLNGTPLDGSVQWNGSEQAVLTVPFAQSLLGGTENGELAPMTLTVQGDAQNGAQYSLFYIESVAISYDRKMYALDNQLRLQETEPGTVVTVSGFTNDGIRVIEAPNTAQAAWREDLTVTESADGYQVSFRANGGVYQLSASPLHLAPEPDYPSRLLSRRNRADYLIIAPRSLQQSAEALSTLRSSSYTTQIIWLQDIYDVFSAGRVDSSSIEKFLRYVHLYWSQVPEYVVLLGRGTLDHPDRQGLGESLIPLRMAATPWGLIGSDNRYADVDGDYVPDFSIGRISVSTDTDGLAFVEKLRSYESASSAGSWSSHGVVVADDPDPEAGDFHANSDEVASLLSSFGFSVEKLYHPEQTVHGLLVDHWSAGLYGLVNYDGHGGRTQLGKSSENFFKSADVAGLNNGTNLPVFAAFTCAAGDSSYPGVLSLGDTLTLDSTGGSIASVVPTGLSSDAPAHRINRFFVDQLVDKEQSVGRALRAALQDAAETTMVPFMFDVYHVAGDPAVEMKRPVGYRISDGAVLEAGQ